MLSFRPYGRHRGVKPREIILCRFRWWLTWALHRTILNAFMNSECAEKLRLRQELTQANEAVRPLKEKQNRAQAKNNPDAQLFAAVLEQARTAQRDAARALRDHISQHHCST